MAAEWSNYQVMDTPGRFAKHSRVTLGDRLVRLFYKLRAFTT